MGKTHKLYCFVDETGQDTKGRFYIVVIIMSINPRDQLFELLLDAEKESGKGKLKWSKNSTAKRYAYIDKTLRAKLPLCIYYQIFKGLSLSYEFATVLAIASAINSYVRSERITDYKATVIIDGLPRTMQGQVAKLLRNFGIRTRTVRGERDQSNPGIRLADAIAGLIRQAYLGDRHYTPIITELESRGTIKQIL